MSGASSLLADGGDTGGLVRARDWAATPLDPIEGWPGSLWTMLRFLLRSPVPRVEGGVMLCNDACSAFAGGWHSALLGSGVCEGWPEVASLNDHVMRVGLAGGTLAYRNQDLTLYRHGRPEQVWMDLDDSPVPGDDGRPAGVLCILAETTGRVAVQQRWEAEVALLTERDRVRGVLDSMGDAFALLDRELRIADLNAEAVRLGNRLKDATLGRARWEVHPNAAPELVDLNRQVIQEHRPVAIKHRHKRFDGRDT